MLVNKPQEYEYNLENIENDLRMERIRQKARHITWEQLGTSVRRNLLEKRTTLDADSRMDVQKAIQFLRKKVPIEKSGTIFASMKQMADSLGCHYWANEHKFELENEGEVVINGEMFEDKLIDLKISYWNYTAVFSKLGIEMLENSKFTEFRDRVAKILELIPTNLDESKRDFCKRQMSRIEGWYGIKDTNRSFERINSDIGYIFRRGSLTGARIYWIADPCYVRKAALRGKFEADQTDFEKLPYIEISFTTYDKPVEVMKKQGKSYSFETHECVCLRFSKPLVIRKISYHQLEKIGMAKSALVRHYSNVYRYLGRFEEFTTTKKLTTSFDDKKVQHRYMLDPRNMGGNNDHVVKELYIYRLDQLNQVFKVLRGEWRHNYIFQSILTWTYKSLPPGELVFATYNTIFTDTKMIFEYKSIEGKVKVCCEEKPVGVWKVDVQAPETKEEKVEEEKEEGEEEGEEKGEEKEDKKPLNLTLTEHLDKHNSIPMMLMELNKQFECTTQTEFIVAK